MRLCTLTILLLDLSFVYHTAFALFADEAYHVDFHHALLGIPQAHTTLLHRPSAGSKASLLYTLSENGIIGAVNPKDGAVVWRQRVGEKGHDYKGRGLLSAGLGSTVVVSALNGKLQTWDAADGRLGWEREAKWKIKAVEIVVSQDAIDAVVASQEEDTYGVVRSFSTDTGIVRWRYQDSSGDTPFALVAADGRLFYLSLHAALLKGFKIKAIELDIANGKQKGQAYLFSSENEVSSDDSILFAGAAGGLPLIVWSDKAFKTIKVGSILHSQTTAFGSRSRHGHAIQAIKVHASSDAQCSPHFLLHFQDSESHWANVYNVDDSTGKATESHGLEAIEGQGAFTASSHSSTTYFVRQTLLEISLTSSSGVSSLQSWRLSSEPEAGPTEMRAVAHIVAEVAPRGANFSVRSFLALESGDWEMVRNGESSWIRREGITGPVAAAYGEVAGSGRLAQELAAEGQYNIVSAYVRRVKRHSNDMQSLPLWIKKQSKIWSSILAGNRSLTRIRQTQEDRFAFGKIIIVATRHGRLAALDAVRYGRAIWNIQAVFLERGATWDVIHISVENDTVLVRAGEGEVIRVETRTGKVVDHQRKVNDGRLGQLVPVTDSNGQQALIPIHSDGSLGETARSALEGGLVVITANRGHSLHGWSLPQNHEPVLAWGFRPPAGGTISQVVHRPVHDPVASIGKVLGDRNVLYKYLNPNVIFVTCESRATASVSFYVLDGVSGDVLHSITHAGVDFTQPVSSSMSENFFAYTLLSSSTSSNPPNDEAQHLTGYQLVISELFESPFPNHRGPLGAASNFSSQNPLHSNGDEAESTPHVVSQTYLIPEPISQLSFTSTLQGITPRSLLCLTPHSNSIISIPRYILEPRRPVGRDPTTAEAEEGLFRYNAILELDPKWNLNHKRESLGFSHVISSPSLLESTSLVFAFGDADLFGTRLSPIGGFDLLGKGFSKFQLVATVAALAVGTAILAPLVRKKQIDGTWKI